MTCNVTAYLLCSVAASQKRFEHVLIYQVIVQYLHIITLSEDFGKGIAYLELITN